MFEEGRWVEAIRHLRFNLVVLLGFSLFLLESTLVGRWIFGHSATSVAFGPRPVPPQKRKI